MIAEANCIGMPLTIIPMVVTEVQDYIAAGQIKPTDLLIDGQQASRPGTLTVFLWASSRVPVPKKTALEIDGPAGFDPDQCLAGISSFQS